MKTGVFRVLFSLLCGWTLTVSLPAWGDKIQPMNLRTLAESAGVIFQGECTAIKTGKDPDSNLTATWYTFRIVNGIKGEIGEEYTLKQYGGTDGDITVHAPTVQFKIGEKVILFLYGKSRIGFSTTVGMQQGKFSVEPTSGNGVQSVTNGMPAMLLWEGLSTPIPSLDAKGNKAHGDSRLRSNRMEVNEFLAAVKDLVKQQREKKE